MENKEHSEVDGERPGLLPPPPERLARIHLPVTEQAGPWFRTHSLDRSPYHYGRSIRHRFDDPLSEFRSERHLRLVDLTGPGLARLGADARLFAGDHGQARQWSRAFYSHPDRVDGIYYPVRHDPSRVAAAVSSTSRFPGRICLARPGCHWAPGWEKYSTTTALR